MQVVVDKGMVLINKDEKNWSCPISHIDRFAVKFSKETSEKEACEVLVEACLQCSNIKHLPIPMQPIGQSFMDFRKDGPIHQSLKDKLVSALLEVTSGSPLGVAGLLH